MELRHTTSAEAGRRRTLIAENRKDAPRRGDGGTSCVDLPGQILRRRAQGVVVGDEVFVITWLHQARRDVTESAPA